LPPRRSAKFPQFFLDPDSSWAFPGFYVFEAEVDNNPGGSVVFGHYAVDQRTGDVWEGVVCKEYTSSKLQQAQRVIRRRIGLTDAEYGRLRRPGPFCLESRQGTTGRQR
jgi:hypothetical protein